MAGDLNELARQLYVDPGDVRVLLAAMTEEPATDDVPAELCGEIRKILDPHGDRSWPQIWNQADMDTWREETGLRKPTPGHHVPGVHGAQSTGETDS